MPMSRDEFSDADLDRIGREIANRLVGISEFFNPGVKLTLIVRNPAYTEADLILTDDNMQAAIAALKHRMDEDGEGRRNIEVMI
jgi:hypothetical protein